MSDEPIDEKPEEKEPEAEEAQTGLSAPHGEPPPILEEPVVDEEEARRIAIAENDAAIDKDVRRLSRRGYFVGLDMQSAAHPQTLLAYELNGQPLTWQHGAPLRLAIPVKYRIKNIKRLGVIRYTNVRPADYWAERGYD